MKGARARLEREHKDRAWLAWHVEALARQHRLPDLAVFVEGRAARPPVQTPEVQQAMCEALARAWGAREIE